MQATVTKLLEPYKGLLAADESFPTIEKRLALIHLPSTADTRRAFREMLFTTPGLGEFISGVILFDETIRQQDSHGRAFPAVLEGHGILPGIKVDEHTMDLVNFPGERITRGLDTLAARCAEYRELGARFTKWRAVFTISEHTPSPVAMQANAEVLARYAAISQAAGLVPIVEPEVLMAGDHPLERCEEVTTHVLRAVFDALAVHRVVMELLLLKPNMVLPGEKSPQQVSSKAVADATGHSLRRAVPAAVPGIVFLSGGQEAVTATEHLNAINQLGSLPWVVSFSFSRALELPALYAWNGDASRVKDAQQVLYHRAKCNSAARQGQYSAVLEQEGGSAQQYAA